MAIVENILSPIFQLLVYLVMGGWFLFIVGYVIIKTWKNLRWQIKYNFLKKPYPEKDVEWCMSAIEKGKNAIEIKKFLLIKGQSKKRISEILFIYFEIQKQMKGGDTNDRQFKQGNGQDQEIQEIN